MPVFTVDNIDLGAGLLLYATVGATEPADLASGWPGGWSYLGWTKDGHQWASQGTAEALHEPEQVHPTLHVRGEERHRVKFSAAELTVLTWQMAHPGATSSTQGWGTIITARDPAAAAPTPIALAFDSANHRSRVIWRSVVNIAPMEVKRAKSPGYATLPFEFAIERPADGRAPWVQYQA